MTTQQKLSIAKAFLKEWQENKEIWVEQLFNADKKYIGETLEKRENEVDKWLNEVKVQIEMAEMFIKDLEETRPDGLETTESKVFSEVI